jgi:hypothetical protein
VDAEFRCNEPTRRLVDHAEITITYGRGGAPANVGVHSHVGALNSRGLPHSRELRTRGIP